MHICLHICIAKSNLKYQLTMCSVLTTGDIVMNKTDKILAPLELNLINKKKKTSRQDNSHSDKCSEENQRCAGIDSE